MTTLVYKLFMGTQSRFRSARSKRILQGMNVVYRRVDLDVYHL